MNAQQLLNKKDLSFLSIDSGPKWGDNRQRVSVNKDCKKMLQRLRNKRLTIVEICKMTGFSDTFISKNTVAPDPLKNEIGIGALIDKVQDGYVFDEELIVTKHRKPQFKLVPIQEDEING